MADEHDIVVEADGTLAFVYADEVAALFEGERLETARASHVEPVTVAPYAALHAAADVPFNPARTGWVADMRPSGGPILGIAEPYPTREMALDAERQWLRDHLGL